MSSAEPVTGVSVTVVSVTVVSVTVMLVTGVSVTVVPVAVSVTVLSCHFVILSCCHLIIRTWVVCSIAAVVFIVIVVFVLKEARVWWKNRNRRLESKNLAVYEDPLYLANIEMEMIRQRREKAEGETRVEENVYEEI